jgi:hypothetical protein
MEMHSTLGAKASILLLTVMAVTISVAASSYRIWTRSSSRYCMRTTGNSHSIKWVILSLIKKLKFKVIAQVAMDLRQKTLKHVCLIPQPKNNAFYLLLACWDVLGREREKVYESSISLSVAVSLFRASKHNILQLHCFPSLKLAALVFLLNLCKF